MDRLRVYLPALPPSAAVLDLGCGRGEWLELLRNAGLPARGVDSNRAMVEFCSALGLAAEEADLLPHLRGLPSGSVDVVTAFHVVEHLPFPVLIGLLDEVRRVLRSNGLIILETPNPNNLLVGSRNFYYDFTHRNPIPPETLRFLVEHRGFGEARVLPLHPCDPCNHVDVSADAAPNDVSLRFNEYFYGPQDYAIIAKAAQPHRIAL